VDRGDGPKTEGRSIFTEKWGFSFVRKEPFTMGKTTVSHLIGYKRIGRSAWIRQKTYTAFEEGEEVSRDFVSGSCRNREGAGQGPSEGYESLKNVRERDLSCGRFSVASSTIPEESRVVCRRRREKGERGQVVSLPGFVLKAKKRDPLTETNI